MRMIMWCRGNIKVIITCQLETKLQGVMNVLVFLFPPNAHQSVLITQEQMDIFFLSANASLFLISQLKAHFWCFLLAAVRGRPCAGNDCSFLYQCNILGWFECIISVIIHLSWFLSWSNYSEEQINSFRLRKAACKCQKMNLMWCGEDSFFALITV